MSAAGKKTARTGLVTGFTSRGGRYVRLTISKDLVAAAGMVEGQIWEWSVTNTGSVVFKNSGETRTAKPAAAQPAAKKVAAKKPARVRQPKPAPIVEAEPETTATS